MSGFPTANFSDSAQGLFTADEIRGLMRVEYERAARYHYPVALMIIDVDRIEYLHDLYGYESKEEILQAVIGLLRAVTRASDFLGCMHEGRLMALFPHTSQAAAGALADRLLSGSRRLKFESGSRTLRTTLSIGLAVAAEDPHLWLDFVQAADDALAYAIEGGGDRYVQREGAVEMLGRLRTDLEAEELALEREHTRLDGLRSALPSRDAAPSAHTITPPSARDLAPGMVPGARPAGQGNVLDPRDRERFMQLVGPVFQELGERTPKIRAAMERAVDLLIKTVERTRRETLDSQAAKGADTVELLERRVAKLKEALTAAEAEIGRVAALKAMDPGLASVYRSVQGLDEGAQDVSRKREMLAVLFEANVKLRDEIDKQKQ
ncbi:MAG: GGDEF domain-containing protein [Planctomycetota bacterium]